jgi:hypothetical protein
MFRLYNYSKTPARGVKEFSMSLDGQLVFMGTLSMSAAGTAQGQCSVLFSNDMKIVRAEKDRASRLQRKYSCDVASKIILNLNA